MIFVELKIEGVYQLIFDDNVPLNQLVSKLRSIEGIHEDYHVEDVISRLNLYDSPFNPIEASIAWPTLKISKSKDPNIKIKNDDRTMMEF